jgi:hypothetical protein
MNLGPLKFKKNKKSGWSTKVHETRNLRQLVFEFPTISYNFQIQTRIVSAETIRGKTVIIFCYLDKLLRQISLFKSLFIYHHNFTIPIRYSDRKRLTLPIFFVIFAFPTIFKFKQELFQQKLFPEKL